MEPALEITSGPLADAIDRYRPNAEAAVKGLWRRDPSTWSADAAVQSKIANRLGWLNSPELMSDALERLKTCAERVKRDHFTDVVLLGMGGSSLAPEVLRAIVGVAPGWPRFHMLDSTDPAAVLAASTDPATTVYILASKSGTTIEPNSLAAYFRRRLEEAHVAPWASRFIAITDEGTELARRARADGFRDLFINPSDIGGRYSALSFFGLVPAALMGQNVTAILKWAATLLGSANPDRHRLGANRAAMLGLAIGAAARTGRDKLTLVVPPALESLGLWVEQLIAESTGKNGTGLVPIAGETLGRAADYGSDRLFVTVGPAEANDTAAHALRATGAPIIAIDFPEPEALGAEFVRWEIATAIAGAILEIDPFDEPNVQQAKDATRALLDRFKSEGSLPVSPPSQTLDGGVALTLSTAARRLLDPGQADAFLRLLAPNDYFGLLAYLGPDPSLAGALHRFRMGVRDRSRAATMFGYGPRYLHSTGQLHKGGPNSGAFVLVTATAQTDIPIPSEAFSFGTLELAQGLGDFASLDTAGRRALHVHLPGPNPTALEKVLERLLTALPSPM